MLASANKLTPALDVQSYISEGCLVAWDSVFHGTLRAGAGGSCQGELTAATLPEDSPVIGRQRKEEDGRMEGSKGGRKGGREKGSKTKGQEAFTKGACVLKPALKCYVGNIKKLLASVNL